MSGNEEMRDFKSAQDAFARSFDDDESQVEATADDSEDIEDVIEGEESEITDTEDADDEDTEPSLEDESVPTDTSVDILKEIRDQIIAQNSQAPQEAPVVEAAVEEPTEDPFADIPEDFLEKFAEDPKGTLVALKDVIASEVKRDMLNEMSPALRYAQESQIKEKVAGTFDKYFGENEDANNYLDSIREYMVGNQLPLDDPRSLHEAYLTAKNADLSGRKSLDEYLSDDASIEQMLSNEGFVEKILANPALLEKVKTHDGIKGDVISGYLADLKAGKKPATLSDAGGISPATPKNEQPRSFNEAGEMLIRDLSKK